MIECHLQDNCSRFLSFAKSAWLRRLPMRRSRGTSKSMRHFSGMPNPSGHKYCSNHYLKHFNNFAWLLALSSTQLLEKIGERNCILWQYRLWSFQERDSKLERCFVKKQYTQRKLLNFVNRCNGEVSKSAKIWLSKSIFYHFFFIEEYWSTFFDNILNHFVF